MEALKKKVKEKTQIPTDEQRLIFGGKELQDGNYLSKYRISNMATLFLVMRLVGGAEPERPVVPEIRKIDPSIPRAENEPCMIFYTDDNSVKMPCGHVISPDGLIDYSWNEVCVGTKTNVLCCICRSEWDVDVIRRYGGATDEEIALLQECLSRNYCISDPHISECPGCTSYCERINELKKCVVCRHCSNKKGKQFHFCWDCKREWLGSVSNKDCGNDKCNLEEILENLKAAPLKEIAYLGGLKAPSMRACPTCGTLIEHAERCKHITCTVCKVQFCFVCLRICSEGSSFCGNYSTKCSVANRQTVLPRRRNL